MHIPHSVYLQLFPGNVTFNHSLRKVQQVREWRLLNLLARRETWAGGELGSAGQRVLQGLCLDRKRLASVSVLHKCVYQTQAVENHLLLDDLTCRQMPYISPSQKNWSERWLLPLGKNID